MTKVIEIFKAEMLGEEIINNLLLSGDFEGFEKRILDTLNVFYDSFVAYTLEQVSQMAVFKQKLKDLADSLHFKKLSERTVSLQIGTGTYVHFKSYYAEKVPVGYEGERMLSRLYFKSISGSSLKYISRMALLSVITPSYAIAEEVSEAFNCSSASEKNRKISISTGNLALKNRVENMLVPKESLTNKRVLIGIDGGRTRTRDWDLESDSEYGTFATPWVEPKLLVISTIDDEGKIEKKRLPIYDTCFGDDELFKLLGEYLTRLDIKNAKSVQIVADGAPWIWLRAKSLLIELGVSVEKITETLDYYHALEHLNKLEQYLPKPNQETAIKALKDLMWKGDIGAMKDILKAFFPDWEQNPLKPFEYFEKNISRMKYETFRAQKLPIGSGIVESAIRRVINLRFKCPSSFWNKENLEPLFFLRAAFLSGRWKNLISKLNK